MGKEWKLNERIENVISTNESLHLKERITKLEKGLAKMLPLLKQHFAEQQGSLSIVMELWQEKSSTLTIGREGNSAR